MTHLDAGQRPDRIVLRQLLAGLTAMQGGDFGVRLELAGEPLLDEIVTAFNGMTGQLHLVSTEVTRVAREVGREGLLGGQAEVQDAAGSWRQLAESVNDLAGNLTRQVREISAVTSAVAAGDLTQSARVEARGEIAALRDNVNAMVRSLAETVRVSREQDWLKTNLARFGGLLQGHRDLAVVADLIMTELAPLVGAQHGTFFVAEEAGGETRLRLVAGYGLRADKDAPIQYRIGQSLIGQVAKSKQPIIVDKVPPGYIKISSGLGEAPPANVAVLPVVFEDRVLGVVELASFAGYTPVQIDFLQQICANLGVSVNALIANSRTDALLARAQRLTGELQARSAELEISNRELADKAGQLAEQKRAIEVKNAEIEQARTELEQRARQLALASAYKSQFLANMSHELRTPLNSLLILARLLAQNPGGNLTPKQVEYANVIHAAGSDLLKLIDNILDLSNAEAGQLDVRPERFPLGALAEDLRAAFAPLAAEKNLELVVQACPSAPAELSTDRHRLHQVLGNLLSNAVKFTERGRVTLRASADEADGSRVAFTVSDTGIGISPDKLAAIFGAFRQADEAPGRQHGGTGLGLSIAREVAALLAGEITATSDLGRGSTFTLRLPAALPGAQTQLADEAETGASAEPAREVLVFERTGQGLCTLLAHSALAGPGGSRATAAVRTATAPPEGIALLAERPFQCAVVDFGSPSAPVFLDELRQRPELWGPPLLVHAQEQHEATARTQVAELRSAGLPAELVPSLDRLRERITAHALAEAPADAAGTTDVREALHGSKVLIIDDDERAFFAISSALEPHRVEVTRAADGPSGIDALLAAPDTDLVLLDIMMSGMDGYAALAVIRQLPGFADLPVIAVTARAMPADRDKSLHAGAADHVTKPVDTDKLLDAMERQLGRRRRGRPARGPRSRNG